MNRIIDKPPVERLFFVPRWLSERSMSKGSEAMTLHLSVHTSDGPAFEAAQALATPSHAMTPLLPALSRVLIRRPFRNLLGSTESSTYHSRSIVMIKLHKPQRASYGQAVEAHLEFGEVHCSVDPPMAECYLNGPLCCCC